MGIPKKEIIKLIENNLGTKEFDEIWEDYKTDNDEVNILVDNILNDFSIRVDCLKACIACIDSHNNQQNKRGEG